MKRMLMVLAAVISAAAVRVATADVAETKSTLSGGVLTLDVKSGDTLNYTQPINEVTAIVKNGDGKAYLKLGDTLSTFSGTVTVNAGIVGADTLKNWGVPSRVDVMSGASFDLALADGMSANPKNLDGVMFYIAGPGASGTAGAICRGAGLGGNVLEQVINRITLTADATIGTSSGRIAYNGVTDMQQHTLSVNGPIYFEGGSLTNPGHIVLKKGGAYFDNGFTFNGSSANTLTFEGTSYVEHWNYSGTCAWSVVVNGSDQEHGQNWDKYSRISVGGNAPVWSGPFTVTSGGFSFATQYGTTLKIKDTTIDTTDASCASGVRGPYIVIGSDANANSKVLFDNVTVTQLAPNGRTSEFMDITASNFEWTAPNKTHQLQRLGVKSPNAYIHNAGTVKIAKQSYVAASNRGEVRPGRLIVEDTAISKSAYLCIGQTGGYSGIFEMRGKSSISGDLSLAKNGSSGTVIVRDGSTKFMFTSGQLGGGDNKADLGCLALLKDGTLTHDGDGYKLGIRGASFFEINGGTFLMPNKCSMTFANEGYGDIYVCNGGHYKESSTSSDWGHGDLMVLRNGTAGNFDADFTGAQMTITGAGSLFEFNPNLERYCRLFSDNNQARTFTLNLVDGGTLFASRIERATTKGAANGTRFYIGFNGGVLKIARSHVFFATDNATKAPDEMVVYDGGAIFDTSEMIESPGNPACKFIGNLRAPSGKCIASISLPTDDAFTSLYYSTPVPVRIKGGNGKCASARAIVNYDMCKLERIEVTNPGVDYDENTVVTITSPKGDKTFTCAYTLGTQAGTGGLTKRGKGELRIYDVASYGGALRVEGGVLSGDTRNGSCVFPSDRPLEMTGGTLYLGNGNYKLTVTDLSGYGALREGLYQVKNSFSVDAADLLAGRCLDVPDGFAFSEGVTLTVTGYDKLTPEQKAAFDGLQKMTVVKFASKYTGPLPTFDPTPFGGKRRLTLSGDGKTLQFKGYQGLFIVVQ